jgi:hypothetical protein
MKLLFRAIAVLAIVAMVATGCMTNGPIDPGAPAPAPIDWTPLVRAVDDAVNQYVAAKFPEPTPEQSLGLALKAIALEAAIIAMQRAGAPPSIIAEQRAKADAVYGPAKDEVKDIVEAAPALEAPPQ